MWMEVVKIDLKKCNLSKDLAQASSEWRNKIHVADPNIVGQGFDGDDDDDAHTHRLHAGCELVFFEI